MTCAVPTVDPEFSRLIPPLAADERHRLERSLLAEGCREPLLVWQEQNLLLDAVSWQEAEKVIATIYSASPELAKQVKDVLE